MSKWIWINNDPKPEEYGYFKKTFSARCGAALKIAAETDYIAYLNGERLGFCAFAGWRKEKYFDTYILNNLLPGENTLEITVRYEGTDSATHIDDGAGLWFEIEGVCGSDETVLCAEDTRYVSHEPKYITTQLGYSSHMVSAALPALRSAAATGRECALLPRPVRTMDILPLEKAVLLDEGKRLYDLGRETVGYVQLEIYSETAQTVTLGYGEHIIDGCVRRSMGPTRDYALRFTLTPGLNRFTQLFVRAAARYLQLYPQADCEVRAVGMLPAMYPVTEKECALTGLDRRIYDVCVRTLRLCMHTHYEDCPWREQALYVLDSRNQMLCGYRAFNETEFARANLVFISKGVREDGLLELTYPAVNTPAIPFFSVMYPVEVWEYIKTTGDSSLAAEVIGTVRGIMNALNANLSENGLIANFPHPYWNFYEWIDGSDAIGELITKNPHPERYDLILNCAYCLAAEAVRGICLSAGLEAPALHDESVRENIKRVFGDGDTFVSSTTDRRKTRLGNALACLAGLGTENTVKALMGDKELMGETLSMSGFVYDAILSGGKQNAAYVLADIRRKYGYMLDHGATSFWETIKGAEDFDGAGSLCHGWSAIPILYLTKFAEA